MIKKILETIFILFVVYYAGANYISAYFKTSLCKKYIEIKSSILADILIANGYGRTKTDKEDRNKMAIIGFISYIYMLIFIGPFIYGNIFSNSQEIQILFLHIYILNLPFCIIMAMLNNIRLFTKSGFDGMKGKIEEIISIIGFVIFLLCVFIGTVYLIACIYNEIKLFLMVV